MSKKKKGPLQFKQGDVFRILILSNQMPRIIINDQNNYFSVVSAQIMMLMKAAGSYLFHCAIT